MAYIPTPWEGTFQSTLFNTVKGTIYVDDFDAHSTSDYTTQVTVSYTGIYRNGTSSTVHIDIVGNTMSFSLGDQDITFTLTTPKNESNLITGIYTSTNPSDTGTFTLVPEGYHQPFATTCCLL
jgi:hypothetical protein